MMRSSHVNMAAVVAAGAISPLVEVLCPLAGGSNAADKAAMVLAAEGARADLGLR
jgi:hypothetical protein